MKSLSAGLMLVNVATVSALLLGMIGGGLGKSNALLALLLGLAAAVLAFLRTNETSDEVVASETDRTAAQSRHPFRHAWFWILASFFAFFAFRAFCWLLFMDGNQLKVQSLNNLGDLSLHFTYIRTFANGVPLWPENPIHPFSYIRYPAGVDIFNSLLLLLGLDITRGLIWTGLIASAATFYALYRWGGAFTVAGFLFNGGLFQLLHSLGLFDYRGDQVIAWKSLPLTMFVTQRGLLYALPAGLLLLYHWRAKYFPADRTRQRSKHQGLAHLAFLARVVALRHDAAFPCAHLHGAELRGGVPVRGR